MPDLSSSTPELRELAEDVIRGADWLWSSLPFEPPEAIPVLLGERLSSPLRALKEWLDAHPAEVVPATPDAPAGPSPSRAYSTFVELADWLGMTQEELAGLFHYGRTTPLAWRRGHEPRRDRVRQLYQTHALVGTLVRRLGREATQSWFERGAPSPRDLIANGDVSAADDLAEALIFGTTTTPSITAWVDRSDDQPTRDGGKQSRVVPR